MTLIQEMIAQNRTGQAVGLPCFCTANEQVLRAILAYTAKTGFPTVIEATCNQVNQDGGYTGMSPNDFIVWIRRMADEFGVTMDKVILGGDHLGPNPWRSEPVEIAMDKARAMVKLYVEAGFTKIHLDASMACGGEDNPSFEQIADRSADLCAVAEKYAPDPEKLIYIIGTEVPIPGGETDEPDALDVTSVSRFIKTVDTHQEAWAAYDLADAWQRIVSVVTQPGVDFGHTSVYPFVPEKAHPLRDAILKFNGLVFEAHSTDYQTTKALHDLVKCHFFFLKVGPELTFRFREAVFALASIEEQLAPSQPSQIREILKATMDQNPGYWQDYYTGSPDEIELLKSFSYSDRIRYYWANENVSAALQKLVASLRSEGLAETMISQSFMGLDFGAMPNDPAMLIDQHIQRCVARYFEAAGFDRGSSDD
ncbi:MAG: class II D-tagatose-bisphosphate aldolase, non-catalytic subunit [Alphaproteobacteria bacterium]|jgi:D-tagatose-1,6-bisphosphate aldolase subunit GatZ/KbaZ